MAGDDPPFLPVGTEVSAKYRGAFCEAKVKKIVKSVKCKIYLKETLTSIIVIDDTIIKGILKVGATVEYKNPDNGQIMEAVVNKLTDCSMYTVVFDDGDEKTLRRSQCCLKGEKHFIESETLDNLPLSHPEHFGTPVMNSKTKRRSGRPVFGNEEEDSEEESTDESLPRRASYKGRNQELVGKVFLAEIGEKKKQVLPVLVVLPDAHATELKTKDHFLVKSFKDGKFHTYVRKELKEFSKESIAKIEDKNAKQALERAVTYSDNQELPSNWEREELLGTDEEDFSDEEEASDDEPSEEKDRFIAQLYKFMDDRGTSINKMPTLGNKDLSLYRLFNIVQNLGGYNKVTNLNKWKAVAGRMKTGLPSQNMVSHQLKTAYKKYLHAFEDFYRKLGSTMGTISRPGRSRNNSGRGMGVYKGQIKEQEKEIAADKQDSKSDAESDTEDGDSRSTRSPPKRERITRRDLDLVFKENRERRDGSKDSRRSDTFKHEEEGKKTVTIKEEGKKTKSNKKQEDKKESEDEEVETGKQEDKKKTVRRRSARKEDVKKEEDEETEDKKTETKTKTKVPAAKESEVKPGMKKQEETKDAKIEKKDDKKIDAKKEKTKVTKKDVKKEVEEENKDVEKVEKKTKKDGGKKAKNEEETSTGKKKAKEEVEEDMIIADDAKTLTANEYPLGTKLQVRYGKGRTEKVYDAKIIEIQKNAGLQYLVHYAGWNTRYDEWIRPEQVVNVLNRPSDAAILKKKAKESPPKSPKGQASKKGKSPAAAPCPGSLPVVQRDSRPVKRSPAHTPNTPHLKQNKQQRPTRSNSIEQKGLDSLPGKPRRTRKTSGVTESSDLVSQGSVSDDNNEFEGDIESDGTDSVELKSGRDKDEMSEKSEDSKPDKEDDDRLLMDYSKIVDKKTDMLAVEQDLLNKAAEIEKVNELVEEKENKTADLKFDVKGKEEKSDKLEDLIVKSPPKLDSIGKSQLLPTKDLEMPTIQAVDDHLVASPSSGNREKKEEGENNSNDKVLSPKEPQEDLTSEKIVKGVEGISDCGLDDRFEFKEEEELENFSEVTVEKEVKEKAKTTDSKEKMENEVEKKQRGRKKDPSKIAEKKEPAKEKKRGRPSLASIAEKKAAGQVPAKLQEDSEPVPKKIKEKVVDETGDLPSESANKVEELTFEPATKNDEEIPKEENEFEKKKVKKKMKRKLEVNSDTEIEKKEKREPCKGLGKASKVEKTIKSKGKKVKEEEDVDSLCTNEWEDNSHGESDTVLSDSNKSQSVIPSESDTAGADHSESATKDIAKDTGAILKESCLESKSEESMDSKCSTSRLPNASALYENTPPTTPEHEMDVPSASREQTHDLVKTDCNNSNDQQYASESPSGNASPSSNDGSVGSGNVACSESSNNEAPVHTSLGKRRRESEEVTPSKRKRRGKQKPERRLTKQAGSDSDEGPERHYSPDPGSASPTKVSSPVRTQSQRTPKYQLNLEDGKYLEGEKRIAFLMDKIQEMRKIYMNLKSEVACIDRRRKRARRRERERESAQNSSSGTPEGETTR